jgi:hypothetical protein
MPSPNCRCSIKPVPGLLALVRRARARGLPCAIASAASRDLVHAGLSALGLAQEFSVVVTLEDVQRVKPAPDLYLEAARRLRIPPDRCLAIDDAPDGITAALTAGMTVLTVHGPDLAPIPLSCPAAEPLLMAYLRHRLPPAAHTALRDHLDSCVTCWQRWNRYRWDHAAGTALYEQVRAFLGRGFTPYLDSSRELAASWRHASPADDEQVRAFYQKETAYLYNLAIWEASGNRPRYVQYALPDLRQAEVTTIVDFGCGIGSDTIELRAHGFTVFPVDLPSPHADFASWRMRHAGQPSHITDPRDISTVPAADAVWVIDTLDHLPDLDQALGRLLQSACLVITENLHDRKAHGAQGFHHRRAATDVQAGFATYGLVTQDADSDYPLIFWRKAAPSRGP